MTTYINKHTCCPIKQIDLRKYGERNGYGGGVPEGMGVKDPQEGGKIEDLERGGEADVDQSRAHRASAPVFRGGHNFG